MIVRWFNVLGATVIAVCMATSIALAANTPDIESTPIPTPPKPDFSSMNFNLGSWTCSTQSARRPAPYITTIVTTMDPSGYWMVSKSTTAKSAWAPMARTTDWITWDADTHRWIDLTVGDYGAYGTQTSPGWVGNSMTWTDMLFKPGADVIAVTPVTTTKVSDSNLTQHSTFRERSSGKWIAVDTTCTKSM